MKQLIAAVLAVLCLAGCSAKEEKAEMIGVTVVTQGEAVEKPVEDAPVEQPPVQEFEIQIETEEDGSVAVPVEAVEGLVGDAVGYSFQLPVFTEYAASETMNEFYTDLINGLVDYANGAVNDTCLKENCIASVYGQVLQATLEGDRLDLQYECRVEFSNEDADTVNVRTDSWNIKTGEVTSEMG